MNDPVNPSHYDGTQCADLIWESLGCNGYYSFCLGNIIKYVYRHANKNGVEDLKKARRYAEMAMERLNNNSPCDNTPHPVILDDYKSLPDSAQAITLKNYILVNAENLAFYEIKALLNELIKSYDEPEATET